MKKGKVLAQAKWSCRRMIPVGVEAGGLNVALFKIEGASGPPREDDELNIDSPKFKARGLVTMVFRTRTTGTYYVALSMRGPGAQQVH